MFRTLLAIVFACFAAGAGLAIAPTAHAQEVTGCLTLLDMSDLRFVQHRTISVSNGVIDTNAVVMTPEQAARVGLPTRPDCVLPQQDQTALGHRPSSYTGVTDECNRSDGCTLNRE